jgi:hypothetical protein
LLTTLLQEKTGYALFNLNNLDAEADIVNTCLFMTWPSEAVSHSHRLNVKDPSPSDWLLLTSLNGIAPVGKALDRDTVFITLTDGALGSQKLFWNVK